MQPLPVHKIAENIFVGLKKQNFHFPNVLESNITSRDAISDLENSSSQEFQSYTHLPANDFQLQMRFSRYC